VCTHRGHGHVRPELTDEARRGGRIKKIYDNNNSDIIKPQTNWEGGRQRDDGHPRSSLYMTKITTLNCYIRYISLCIVIILLYTHNTYIIV